MESWEARRLGGWKPGRLDNWRTGQLENKRTGEVAKWKLEKHPDGPSVWISSTGETRWDPSPPEGMLTLEETYGSAAPLSDEDVLAILKHKVRGVDTEDGQRTLFQLFSHGLLCVPREVRDEPLREESGAVPKARRDDAGAVSVSSSCSSS